jgi:MinD superfamily P-loop ATPase
VPLSGATSLTVAVASGKGGTGKTLAATNLAYVAAASGHSVALVDCDAEAPNDAIFLPSTSAECHAIVTPEVVVDPAACTACGACRDACAYGAMRLLGPTAMLFPELCHGCGLCAHVCPTGAISDASRRIGKVCMGRVPVGGIAPRALDPRHEPGGASGSLALVSGTLDVGEVKTPEVVRAARRHAAGLAPDLTVLDAPPGVACAAVAAVRGADVLLLVTEPTPFGLHDLELSYELGCELGIPVGVLVNRAGAGATDIDAWCHARQIPVLARLPFDREIAEVYARGDLLASAVPSYHEIFRRVLESARLLVRKRSLAVSAR